MRSLFFEFTAGYNYSGWRSRWPHAAGVGFVLRLLASGSSGSNLHQYSDLTKTLHIRASYQHHQGQEKQNKSIRAPYASFRGIRGGWYSTFMNPISLLKDRAILWKSELLPGLHSRKLAAIYGSRFAELWTHQPVRHAPPDQAHGLRFLPTWTWNFWHRLLTSLWLQLKVHEPLFSLSQDHISCLELAGNETLPFLVHGHQTSKSELIIHRLCRISVCFKDISLPEHDFFISIQKSGTQRTAGFLPLNGTLALTTSGMRIFPNH